MQPTNPVEVADRLLVDISRDATTFFGTLTLEGERFLDYFLPGIQDFYKIIHSLQGRGYLGIAGQDATAIQVNMHLPGWERVRELENTVPRSWRAFVAMAFDSDMDDAWSQGIRPALEEVGYDAIRVDKVPHLGKIDDKILAELRIANLVVADFTKHKGGVYFEAGFALGRGVPVIWTCRSDEIGASHFDTRQYNHVCWTGPEDLREKLRDRLLATVATRSASNPAT